MFTFSLYELLVGWMKLKNDSKVSQAPWSFISAVLLFLNGFLKVEICDAKVLATQFWLCDVASTAEIWRQLKINSSGIGHCVDSAVSPAIWTLRCCKYRKVFPLMNKCYSAVSHSHRQPLITPSKSKIIQNGPRMSPMGARRAVWWKKLSKLILWDYTFKRDWHGMWFPFLGVGGAQKSVQGLGWPKNNEPSGKTGNKVRITLEI